MKFSELGLVPSLLSAVQGAGYETATDVQQRAIPAAISGRDLLVSSQTGSGKTAAFLLPSLQRLLTAPTVRSLGPRILVLTPTRELAQQVEAAAVTYGRGMGFLNTACLVGGAPFIPQLRKLQKPVDIVIATPGRLLDHMRSGKINFNRLEVLVLDEADRMLDMGFIDDIRAIVQRTPQGRQTMMFSATLDGVVGALAAELTRDAERIEVRSVAKTELQIEQRLHLADGREHKNKMLDHILRDDSLAMAVVFTSTKRATEELSADLRGSGISAAALHGDMHQKDRTRTIGLMRQGRARVLVATDVAARGIDISGISHVINYDMPRQAEDYVHRIGRTGRAGRTGTAITFAIRGEERIVKAIERFTGKRLTTSTIPGLEPIARAPASEFGKRPPHRGRPGSRPAAKPRAAGSRFAQSR